MDNGLIPLFISMTMTALTYSDNLGMRVHAGIYAIYLHISKKDSLGA